MAYSTAAEVQADFPSVTFTDDATSKVKLANIPGYIAEADALIDSYLAVRYSTPVTAGATALELLRYYSRALVADRIKGMLEIKQQTNTQANQNVRTGLSTKEIIKTLENYRDGSALLIGATELEVYGNVGSLAYGLSGRTPRFSLSNDDW